MERIGLISKDERLKSDLGKWLEELPGEFEFVDLGPPATADPSLETPDTLEAPVLTENIKPKFVIFDANFGVQLSKMREELNLKDIPWLAIGLEEHARNPHDPLIRGADDLVLNPLDKSVFMQKVEYILAGDASVTPSYLYLAKADLPIELAKAVHITHISETGCTILSPRPVARGVEGTLVSKLFGTGPNERVEVRAVESVPCFDSSLAIAGGKSEPTFEVKLRFFGFRHSQLTELRRWITSHLPHGLPEITRSDAKPESVAHIALISPQSSLAPMLRSSLEKLAHVEVKEFQGFNRFRAAFATLKPVAGATAETEGPLSAQTWSKEFIGPKTREEMVPALPHPQVTIFVRMATEQTPNHVEKISPPLHGAESLLSVRFDAWSRDLSPLTNGLKDSDREAFNEALDWIIANSNASNKPEVQIVDTVSISTSMRLRALLKISLAEAASPAKPALIKIQIEEAAEVPVVTSAASPDQPTYEAVLVDASLLGFDLKTRIQAVGEWIESFDIKNSFGTRPPLIVFNAKEDRVSAQDFRGTTVRQLVYDFTDRRYQAELFISLSRPNTPLLALRLILRRTSGAPHARQVSAKSVLSSPIDHR